MKKMLFALALMLSAAPHSPQSRLQMLGRLPSPASPRPSRPRAASNSSMNATATGAGGGIIAITTTKSSATASALPLRLLQSFCYDNPYHWVVPEAFPQRLLISSPKSCCLRPMLAASPEAASVA